MISMSYMKKRNGYLLHRMCVENVTQYLAVVQALHFIASEIMYLLVTSSLRLPTSGFHFKNSVLRQLNRKVIFMTAHLNKHYFLAVWNSVDRFLHFLCYTVNIGEQRKQEPKPSRPAETFRFPPTNPLDQTIELSTIWFLVSRI